jgi:hypothetical protein
MCADLREPIERADPGTRQLIFDAAGGVRLAALNTATMRVGLGPVSADELALSVWACKRTQSSQFGADDDDVVTPYSGAPSKDGR